MYNGIGLQTTRGSGTNGYVQRNLGFVRVNKETVEYKPDEDVKKLEAYISKKGNAELLKHDRKRKIEVKCLEMEEMMSEQGFDIKSTNNSIKIPFYLLTNYNQIFRRGDSTQSGKIPQTVARKGQPKRRE